MKINETKINFCKTENKFPINSTNIFLCAIIIYIYNCKK